MRRALPAVALLVLILFIAGLWWLSRHRPPAPEPPTGLSLTPVAFDDLPGWAQDGDLRAALDAFARACPAYLARKPDRPIGDHPWMGLTRDWQKICRDIERGIADPRAYLQREMRPFAVQSGDDPRGLFTGYYEPLLHGNRFKTQRYSTPLYAVPSDLITVDLGAFRKDLAGQTIVGEVSGQKLVPAPDRDAIDKGRYADRGLELLWVDSAVDAFFLHIQGSGRVQLPSGEVLRVGYAGRNGRPYVSLGKLMARRGLLPRDQISSPTIARWLEDHPVDGQALMAENPSYIFFRLLDGEGPLGAQGVPLTPERSLAVDPRFIPYGSLLWLDVPVPGNRAGDEDQMFQRLMVAQDTGGAIRGVVRGDIFWGFGDRAEHKAGNLAHYGRYYLLLPKAAVIRARGVG